jgi:hypothetical protein
MRGGDAVPMAMHPDQAIASVVAGGLLVAAVAAQIAGSHDGVLFRAYGVE